MAIPGRYARLEATARYFDGQSATPREVTLSFGERALTITDGSPLAHWPLATLRAVTDRADATIQLVPAEDSDERIVLSDQQMISAIQKVCPDLYRRRVNRRGVKKAFVYGGTAIAAVVLVVFVIIPGLANQLAQMVPPDKEVALGDAVSGQVLDVLAWMDDRDERVGICDDPDGVAALATMAARIDPQTDLPYPLKIRAIDHKLENAVALPGGHILLFRGLIETAETPEEVAGVLAHEIGHVVHRDPTRGVLRSAGTAGILGLLLGDVFGGGAVVAASEAVLNASYQRDAETKADEVAYRLMSDNGLPLAPFANFFERMKEKYGDHDETALRYFASHPGLGGRAERAAAADKIGDGAFDPVLDKAGWAALQGICKTTEADEDAEE